MDNPFRVQRGTACHSGHSASQNCIRPVVPEAQCPPVSPGHPGPGPHSGIVSESRVDCGGEGAGHWDTPREKPSRRCSSGEDIIASFPQSAVLVRRGGSILRCFADHIALTRGADVRPLAADRQDGSLPRPVRARPLDESGVLFADRTPRRLNPSPPRGTKPASPSGVGAAGLSAPRGFSFPRTAVATSWLLTISV